MNKQDLIHKLKQLEGLNADEKAALIELVKTKKKYGLVWEDKPEAVEDQLRQYLPVLREVKEKRILAEELPQPAETNTELFEKVKQGLNQPTPNHILIEGDNLHALTALTFTHEGKIDVIYIDPPYNTGNKDFKYNDTFVDKEDSFKHSKWLSFMEKRLRIANSLLADKGVIFISIDDNEQAQLRLLCDEIFGSDNFVDNIIWEKNYAPRNDAKYFSAAHDFIVVYKKGNWERKLDDRSEKTNEPYKLNDNDGRGLYRTDNVLVKSFSLSGVFPVTNPITGKEYLPAKGSCWRFSKDTFQMMIEESRIYWGKDGKGAPQVKRYLNEVKQGMVPQTIWKYQDVGHTQDGKNELKDFDLSNRAFETPKPTKLIKKILGYDVRANATILDFFAGSGTTLNAAMQLNAEDGGFRKCIMITNNENNICEEVTYERNNKVIKGYTNVRGTEIDGLTNNNLRYYRSEFISSTKTETNKRLLTQASTELLQIKENCYTDVTEANNFDLKQCGIFINDLGKYMIVVYHSRNQAAVCEKLISYINTLQIEQRIKLYAFSPEKEALAADFAEVADKIEALPLPDAIYNAYRATFRTLRLDRKILTPAETIETEDAPELFDTNTEA